MRQAKAMFAFAARPRRAPSSSPPLLLAYCVFIARVADTQSVHARQSAASLLSLSTIAHWPVCVTRAERLRAARYLDVSVISEFVQERSPVFRRLATCAHKQRNDRWFGSRWLPPTWQVAVFTATAALRLQVAAAESAAISTFKRPSVELNSYNWPNRSPWVGLEQVVSRISAGDNLMRRSRCIRSMFSCFHCEVSRSVVNGPTRNWEKA